MLYVQIDLPSSANPRVLAMMGAASATGPAKNPIELARLAALEAHGAEVAILTFHRGYMESAGDRAGVAAGGHTPASVAREASAPSGNYTAARPVEPFLQTVGAIRFGARLAAALLACTPLGGLAGRLVRAVAVRHTADG
jgi:hypothetical protein